jgi:transketolase
MAAVELLSALYFGGVLRFDPADPRHPDRDRVLVRGHLGPLRYAIFSLLGWVDVGELPGYARLDSRLQGHETPDLPGVDMGPSGSLGMLLSYGLGAAIVNAANGGHPWKTYVFLGDGEEQEGNVAEAARHAARLRARNLITVIDANGKQLAGPVTDADVADLPSLWRAYGWHVLELPDGNDVQRARETLLAAAELSEQGPVAVIAHTVKGVGLAGAADHFSGFHELGHGADAPGRSALAELESGASPERAAPVRPEPPRSQGRKRPGRAAEGADEVLAGLVNPDQPWPAVPDEYQLTYFERLAQAWPKRGSGRLYFLHADTFPAPLLDRTGLRRAAWCANVGIREQHLVALAHGIALSDPSARIIAHTGDPFVLRAADQLHAATMVGSRIILIGDDAGLTNSRNGISHQSSIQPLVLGGMDGVHMLEPCDGVDFANVMNHALAATSGVHYVRVHDGDVGSSLSTGDRTLGAYRVRDDPHAALMIIASGYPVSQALSAADLLAEQGVPVTVVNAVDPAAAGTAALPAMAAGLPVVTVYDGSTAVLEGPVVRTAVHNGLRPALRSMGFQWGTSGLLPELLSYLELDASSIAGAALDLLRTSAADIPSTGDGS